MKIERGSNGVELTKLVIISYFTYLLREFSVETKNAKIASGAPRAVPRRSLNDVGLIS